MSDPKQSIPSGDPRLAIVLIALLAGLLTLLIGAATSEARVVSKERQPGSAGGLSPKQMRSAEPRELTSPPPAAEPTPLASTAGAEPSGRRPLRERSIPGRPPEAEAPYADPFPTPEPGTFLGGEVTDPQLYPNSTWGKLFGRIRGIGSFTCSASVVRSRNRNIIFTAGHCVYDPLFRRWVKRLTFIPAYTDGARPYGAWTWKRAYADERWMRYGNANFDYAVVVMKRQEGRRLEDETGSLGFVYDAKRRRTYRAAGYPANKAEGERMWECVSGFKRTDPRYQRPGPKPVGIRCDMTQGASGGGWATTDHRLLSLSSFGYAHRPGELYGPSFSKPAERMRRLAQRG